MHPLAKLHRMYVTITLALAAVPRLIAGVFMALIAIAIFGGGIWLALLVPDFGWVALAVFTCLTLYLGWHAAKVFFEALPNITPRRLPKGPGQSRNATRAELKRGGVIS